MIELKNVNIFLSSTFNDMHAERDYIRKEVAPNLNELLEKHGIKINIIDLRWGVDTRSEDEENRESKVLDVCLDAIKDCKPYFIALLGDRYGWVPLKNRTDSALTKYFRNINVLSESSNEGISVTEMEIIVGSLSDTKTLDHSLFLIRDSSVYDEMEESDRLQYTNTGDLSSKNDERQKALKEKIISVCQKHGLKENVFFYTPKWDSNQKKFRQFDQIGEAIRNHILRDLQIDNTKQTLSHVEEEIYETETFLGQLKRNFSGRKNLVDSILSYFKASTDAASILTLPRAIVLTGESGSGKSSLLAELYFRLLDDEDSHKTIILLHSAGVTEESVKVQSLFKNMTSVLASHCGEVIGETEILSNDLILKLIKKCQQKGFKIALLLDSVENFEDKFKQNTLLFLPPSVRIFATAQPDAAELLCKDNKDFNKIEIGEYSLPDAEQLIFKILGENYKELPERLVRLILNKKLPDGRTAATQVMWLQIVMSILMELGADDFQRIRNVNVNAEDLKIELFLEKIINELPGKVEESFNYLVEKAAEYFNEGLIKRIICLIALFKYGVTEGDIKEMIGDDWDEIEFRNIRRWLRKFLYKSPVDGKISLTHSILKKAALAFDTQIIEECKSLRSDFLWKTYKYDRLSENELCLLCIEENDYVNFNDLLYEGVNFSYLLKQELFSDIHNKILNFISRYVELYPVNFGFATSFLDDLYSLSLKEPKYLPFAEDLFGRLNNIIDKSRLSEGDPEVFENYMRLFSGLFYMYETTEDIINMRLQMDELKNLYFGLRSKFHDDASFMPNFIWHTGFYSYWEKYISIFRSLDRYGENPTIANEYKRNFIQLIDELKWYVANVEDLQTKAIVMPYILSFELTNRNLILDEETLIQVSLEIKEIELCQLELARNVLSSSDRKKINSFIEELDIIIKQIYSVPAYLNIPNIGYKSYEKESNENDISDSEFFDNDLFMEQYVAEKLVTELSIHENYLVSDDTLEKIIDVAHNYWGKDNREQYFLFMECICDKLFHNLYHHFDSHKLKNIFFDLAEKYKESGQTKKAFDLVYKILDIIVRCQFEIYFDTYEFFHRDTGYVVRYYDMFFEFIESDKVAVERFEKDLNYLKLLSAHNEDNEVENDDDLDDYEYFCAMGEQSLAPCRKKSLSGYADKDRNIFIPYLFSKARAFFDGLAAIQEGSNGLWGFINETGKQVIPCQYREVGDFHEGLAWFCPASSKNGFGCKGAKFGFIDQLGQVVISPEYEDISSFMHGYAIGFKGDKAFKIEKKDVSDSQFKITSF